MFYFAISKSLKGWFLVKIMTSRVDHNWAARPSDSIEFLWVFSHKVEDFSCPKCCKTFSDCVPNHIINKVAKLSVFRSRDAINCRPKILIQ